MNYASLLTIIGTLFLLLICGYACRRLGIIDDTASKKLSTLIIQVGQPMMILSSLSSAEFSMENLKDGGVIALVGLGVHAFMSGLAFLMCVGFKDPDERKITEFSLVFNNAGFIGFPILEALFGPKGLFLASFYVISFHLFIWSWGIAILARGRDDIRLTVKKVLINFGSVPCFIGVLIYMLGIPFPGFALPEFIAKFLSYLSGLCTPISVLITGALLATRTPKQIFGSGKIYYFSCMKLLAMPVIVCVVGKLIGLPNDMVIFITAEAALPSASTITMFSETYRLNGGYASQTVGTSSLLCVLTLPLILKAAEWFVGLW
ncbi:MAG: AEC family transporter [Clostridia bacterium]|nr:AEC family transporter [Clostridia bacterium]